MKLSRSKLKQIINEEISYVLSETRGDSWRSRERNVGEEYGEAELSRIPPEKIQSDYERGFSHWITRQIINKDIGSEELDHWKDKWFKLLSDPFKQLRPEAVESIIAQGIADAYAEEGL